MKAPRPELAAACAATTAAEEARTEAARAWWRQVAEVQRCFIARRVWLEVIG